MLHYAMSIKCLVNVNELASSFVESENAYFYPIFWWGNVTLFSSIGSNPSSV